MNTKSDFHLKLQVYQLELSFLKNVVKHKVFIFPLI